MAPDDITKAFGVRLREARTALDLSQEALAERAGVHRTYVGTIERGQQNVALRNIVRLARALNTTPSDLLRGVE